MGLFSVLFAMKTQFPSRLPLWPQTAHAQIFLAAPQSLLITDGMFSAGMGMGRGVSFTLQGTVETFLIVMM